MNNISEFVAARPITSDSMFAGAVSCLQFRDGYRFSVDAVLAAHFHQPGQGETVLDLGSGCGIIGLIMMYRWGDRIAALHAFEYQPQLRELAEKNFAVNDYAAKCSCIEGDVKNILSHLKPESFSLVVCNPPFYRPDSGRQSRGEESRIARHQIVADILDFTSAAAAAVKNGGTVVFIYPAEHFTELSESLIRVRLEIKQLQFVYSYPDRRGEARLVLVKCTKNGGRGVHVLAPFYIYENKNGSYSMEMQELYEP